MARRGDPLEVLAERIDAERQTTRERFGFVIAICAVIWFFIERHLSELNHENARVKDIADSRVAQATYDANEQQRDKEALELGDWRKEVDRDRTQSVSREELTRETKVEKRAVASSGWQALAGIVAVIVVTLSALSFWTVHHASRPVVTTPTVTIERATP